MHKPELMKFHFCCFICTCITNDAPYTLLQTLVFLHTKMISLRELATLNMTWVTDRGSHSRHL